MPRFVTWGNAYWLAWALWTFACQFWARPFHDVEDWFSTLASSAFISLILAAMTLALAWIAVAICIEIITWSDEL